MGASPLGTAFRAWYVCTRVCSGLMHYTHHYEPCRKVCTQSLCNEVRNKVCSPLVQSRREHATRRRVATHRWVSTDTPHESAARNSAHKASDSVRTLRDVDLPALIVTKLLGQAITRRYSHKAPECPVTCNQQMEGMEALVARAANPIRATRVER